MDALDGEEHDQKTAIEEYQMLDALDSLPWVPLNVDGRDPEYVPPGLNALIEGSSDCISRTKPR